MAGRGICHLWLPCLSLYIYCKLCSQKWCLPELCTFWCIYKISTKVSVWNFKKNVHLVIASTLITAQKNTQHIEASTSRSPDDHGQLFIFYTMSACHPEAHWLGVCLPPMLMDPGQLQYWPARYLVQTCLLDDPCWWECISFDSWLASEYFTMCQIKEFAYWW